MAIKVIFISVGVDAVIFGILVPFMFIGISRMLDSMFLFPRLNLVFLRPAGILLMSIGLVIIVWAYYLIVKVGRGYTLEFFGRAFLPQTSRLVRTGPYSRTRHPFVFGYLVVLLGIAFMTGSRAGIFIMLPFYFLTSNLYLIYFEEKKLYDRFKEEFIQYKSGTNLIIPWFKKGGGS